MTTYGRERSAQRTCKKKKRGANFSHFMEKHRIVDMFLGVERANIIHTDLLGSQRFLVSEMSTDLQPKKRVRVKPPPPPVKSNKQSEP